MEWMQALNFDLALKNVRTDIIADWYRDPWNWGELDWIVGHKPEEFLLPRLEGSGVRATVPLDVPKENFAVRPAVVLDPLDRLVYQALVDRVSVQLVGSLARWAYGWRLPWRDPKPGIYARNDEQWAAYRLHLEALAPFHESALTSDVVSFFKSIPADPLLEQVLATVSNRPTARLVDMVDSWYRTTGRGLPQRCAASAILAHFYLRPVDDVIQHYSEIPKLFGRVLTSAGTALRWMDDIWLFGDDSLDLREAQLAIQGSLRQLGLEMNVGKTGILEGSDMASAVFEIEHSAVDKGIDQEDIDEQPLNALIDRLVAQPEVAERTSIRFAATRMRAQELYERVPDFVEVAARMPHGADHLARLFRDSEHWRDLQQWYVDHANRWGSRLPWSIGQLGTMFPSDEQASSEVRDTFARMLSNPGTPVPMQSVAAQRLAAWQPDEARVLIREAAQTAAHPLTSRCLALAGLHAGEVRNVVRSQLRQHEENAPTLAMLEDHRFNTRAIPVVPDFAGSRS